MPNRPPAVRALDVVAAALPLALLPHTVPLFLETSPPALHSCNVAGSVTVDNLTGIGSCQPAAV